MALVFDNQAGNGPKTHALVIGIGKYPHLIGGDGAKARFDAGMRQLTSPPASARAFASWLISSFNNPERPLATVELLLGDDDQDYVPPVKGGPAPAAIKAGGATRPEISRAALRWKERGNEHPDNLLIFYFCGHGVGEGQEFGLIASDYGSDPQLPFSGLISFNKFQVGMKDCAARHLCYFIDACRKSDQTLSEMLPSYGDSLVQHMAGSTAGHSPCVYYATHEGALAHGPKGQPSYYTRALIQALEGPGAYESGGSWVVNTTRLFEGVSQMMDNIHASNIERVQTPQSGTQVTYDLHHLVGEPSLPFLVRVEGYEGEDPPPAVEEVLFRQEEADQSVFPERAPPLPHPCTWKKRQFETWLPSGVTYLEFTRAGSPANVTRHTLMPPGRWHKEP